MKFLIANKGDGNIITIKEFLEIEGRGEISHFIAELELARLELLEMWEEYEGEDRQPNT